MNRMELDDFCARNGTGFEGGDDRWRERDTASHIMQQALRRSLSTLQTVTSAVTTANFVSKNERKTVAVADF